MKSNVLGTLVGNMLYIMCIIFDVIRVNNVALIIKMNSYIDPWNPSQIWYNKIQQNATSVMPKGLLLRSISTISYVIDNLEVAS